jgi:hypothetical protein
MRGARRASIDAGSAVPRGALPAVNHAVIPAEPAVRHDVRRTRRTFRRDVAAASLPAWTPPAGDVRVGLSGGQVISHPRDDRPKGDRQVQRRSGQVTPVVRPFLDEVSQVRDPRLCSRHGDWGPSVRCLPNFLGETLDPVQPNGSNVVVLEQLENPTWQVGRYFGRQRERGHHD